MVRVRVGSNLEVSPAAAFAFVLFGTLTILVPALQTDGTNRISGLRPKGIWLVGTAAT